MRIDTLLLDKFRGASSSLALSFDPTKALVLIFGENGTGKTTIVDALDFVCNQKYGSLDERSSTKPRRHLPTIGSKAGDVRVVLSAGKGTWEGRLADAGPSVTGPPGCPTVTILRRSHILRVINAQPKDRYAALGDLLRLPGIRASEASLREALNDLESRYNEAARAKDQADEALEELWKTEGGPGANALAWARSSCAEEPSALKTSLAEMTTLISLLDRAETSRKDLEVAESRLETARAVELGEEEKLRKEENSGGSGSLAVAELLRDAEALLGHGTDPSECPLCGSAERVSGLGERISARLSGLTTLIKARQSRAIAQTATERALGARDSASTQFTGAVRDMAIGLKGFTGQPQLSVDWSAYSADLTLPDQASQPPLDDARRFFATTRDYDSTLRLAHAADQKIAHQLTLLKQHLATVDAKTSAAVEFEATTADLRHVLDVVEGLRKAHVDALLQAISSRVEAMYSAVHPGEGLGQVRFHLNPKFIGSLEFDGAFQGTPNLPPQAYYSDSHLDTLGICVFVALAQTETDDKTVIVLDDVLSSVDAPHSDRLMKVLQDEAPNFDQIVITTHYRPWRERFRFRASDSVQLIDLERWSLSRGICAGKTRFRLDELREATAATPFDRQIAASKAGVLLEELLKSICLRYRCKLPAMIEANHSLGDLASAIPPKLEKIVLVEVGCSATPASPSSVIVGPLIRNATRWMWVRNSVGAHFSTPGLDVPDDDVREFAEACMDLAVNLVCEKCGESPGRNRDGACWECRCGDRRLRPLASPGEQPSVFET